MPEGDTIYRTATQLRKVLPGRRIDEVRVGNRWELPGGCQLTDRNVVTIETRGKHLLMHLDNGRVLHSHMGMTGSWHIYRTHERWRKPQWQAQLAMRVESFWTVCFSPKLLELLSATAFRRHPQLCRLGPDLLSADCDLPTIACRFRSHRDVAIGEAIMNQSIVCGIGNVYKSETLFLAAICPFTKVSQFTERQIEDIAARARELMRRNLNGYPRRTRHGPDGSRFWVYGRHGAPCFRCGTTIAMRRQGDLGRSTYWCPKCQSG